ncbi:MAG: alcohol dehydrogenase catalytic domain-containing protein [Clostridia bacterium]|nr:alcohol dehydrogenase catalytic domain-containing protein [Clostridia bacterium]
MKVKAAVFVGPNKDFEVREFEVTKPPKGYAQMDLIASGICGTDIHTHNGKLDNDINTIIGHEFVGRITDVDAAEGQEYGLKVGDAVIADIAVPCGECILCKNGDDANCVNFQFTCDGDINVAPYLYGGYTEVNYTPLTNLIKIPESVDPFVAATFACPGPTAIHACSLAAKAGVNLKDINVAVVQGLGPVGVFAVMYLKRMGVKTVYAITAGDNKKREELAVELGADKVYNLTREGTESITEAMKSQNGGLGVDLCFEASGAPQAVVQGLDILRNRGVYLVPGQYSNSGAIEIQPQMITFNALHIIGSSQYSICDVENYLKFLESNPDLHADIEKLGNKYPVSKINDAIADAKTGNNIKTLLIKG